MRVVTGSSTGVRHLGVELTTEIGNGGDDDRPGTRIGGTGNANEQVTGGELTAMLFDSVAQPSADEIAGHGISGGSRDGVGHTRHRGAGQGVGR